MERINLKILISFFVVLLAPTLGLSTTITTSGHQLMVNCQPFLVRGMFYKPVPTTGGQICPQYDWTTYPDVVDADLALMQQMGVNTIRVEVSYQRLFNNWDNHDPAQDTAPVASELAHYQQCLYDAYTKGIYVIPVYFLNYGVDYTNATNALWAEEQFDNIINTFKDQAQYPNILMWNFSVENNNGANYPPMTLAQMYTFYNTAIGYAKTNADNTHPYMVALTDYYTVTPMASLASAPNVDVWGYDTFRLGTGVAVGSGGYADLFNPSASQYTDSRPLLFSMFGNDAFDSTNTAVNPPPGVEDDADQASALQDRWNNFIGPNSSVTNPSTGIDIGGCIDEWCDEWWLTGGLMTHDSYGSSLEVVPDLFSNYEWYGISNALADAVTGTRTLRTAYTTMQSIWTSAPYNTTTAPACGSSPTPNPTPYPIPTTDPCAPVMFDNFTNGAKEPYNSSIPADEWYVNNWGGYWQQAQTSGNGTIVNNRLGFLDECLQWNFTQDDSPFSFSILFSYLSPTASPSANSGAGTGMVDLTVYNQLTFEAKSNVAGYYDVGVVSIDNYGTATTIINNPPNPPITLTTNNAWYTLPVSVGTNWTPVTVNLDPNDNPSDPNSFYYNCPGGNFYSVQQNLQSATELTFEADYLNYGNTATELSLDEIYFYKASCGSTPTPILTPTNTVTNTVTRTATSTSTNTPTKTMTNTATNTPTKTSTNTVTNTPTLTPAISSTFTNSPTITATNTTTNTPTQTLAVTSTFTNTVTQTVTNTVTNTATLTPAVTSTFTNTATNTATQTSTNTATNTITGTIPATDTPTNTPTNTSTSTMTNTATNTLTPTVTNSATQTPTSTPPTALVTQGPAPPSNSTQLPGTSNVQVLQVVISNPSGSSITTTGLTLTDSGTGNASGIAGATLVKNGTNLSTTTFSGPTGTFSFSDPIAASSSVTYLITVNFSAGALGTYTLALTGAAGTNGQVINYSGLPITEATVTVAEATSTTTMTSTYTITNTPVFTSTPTMTFTSTFTNSPTNTYTPPPTSTPTNSPTVTATYTVTPPLEAIISPPYPNPSNGSTIYFNVQVLSSSTVTMDVFTLAFRKIATQTMPINGSGTLQWNLQDMKGNQVADGLYYVRIHVTGAQPNTKILKVLILR